MVASIWVPPIYGILLIKCNSLSRLGVLSGGGRSGPDGCRSKMILNAKFVSPRRSPRNGFSLVELVLVFGRAPGHYNSSRSCRGAFVADLPAEFHCFAIGGNAQVREIRCDSAEHQGELPGPVVSGIGRFGWIQTATATRMEPSRNGRLAGASRCLSAGSVPNPSPSSPSRSGIFDCALDGRFRMRTAASHSISAASYGIPGLRRSTPCTSAIPTTLVPVTARS